MTAPPASGDAHPRVLADRFELRHVLGTGGMSTVWEAHDRRLGRTVAVKTLRDDLSDAHAERIRREARAAARIDDPRVVTVLDLEHDTDGTPFLVLEALEGRTLADELCDGPLVPERAERLVDDLLGGLAAAHACGVLHRDIKPSNLLLAGDGYRLTDFGIASLDDEGATSGDLMGTLVYLAPERFDGEAATPSSDVFGAAAVLHEAFSGCQPFRGATAAESLHRLRSGQCAPLPDHVPLPVARALAMALDPDPARRPADAAAFRRLMVPDPLAETAPLSGPGPAEMPTTTFTPPTGASRRSSAGEDTVFIDRTATSTLPAAAAPTTSTEPDRAAPIRPPQRSWVDDPRVRRLADTARRPQVAFTTLAVLVLVGLLVVASLGSDSTPSTAGTAGADPAAALDQHLDRIEELGR